MEVQRTPCISSRISVQQLPNSAQSRKRIAKQSIRQSKEGNLILLWIGTVEQSLWNFGQIEIERDGLRELRVVVIIHENQEAVSKDRKVALALVVVGTARRSAILKKLQRIERVRRLVVAIEHNTATDLEHLLCGAIRTDKDTRHGETLWLDPIADALVSAIDLLTLGKGLQVL